MRTDQAARSGEEILRCPEGSDRTRTRSPCSVLLAMEIRRQTGMKRLDLDRSTPSLPTVTLYRRDVEDIVDALRSGGELSIIHKGFLLESIEELHREFGDVIHKLKLEGRALTLEIETRSVRMWNLRDANAADIIEQIIRNRRRLAGSVPEGASVLTAVIGGLFAIPTLIVTLLVGNASVGLLVVLPLAMALISVPFFIPPRSRVILVRPHEHQTFWRRYRADFVKAGIGFGGTLLGYAIRVMQEYFRAH